MALPSCTVGRTGLGGRFRPIGASVCISIEHCGRLSNSTFPATIAVEAGVAMETVQKAADAADLFFPLNLGGRHQQLPDRWQPVRPTRATAVLALGMARDLVLGVEAVLADGTVIDSLRKVIKNNTGYDLRQLFIGAEGTLGIITKVVLKLYPKAKSVCTGIMAVDDYGAVLQLLKRARAGFASQLTAFEVMWPELL
jgi:FAD/FMN-containing dehydrogenase